MRFPARPDRPVEGAGVGIPPLTEGAVRQRGAAHPCGGYRRFIVLRRKRELPGDVVVLRHRRIPIPRPPVPLDLHAAPVHGDLAPPVVQVGTRRHHGGLRTELFPLRQGEPGMLSGGGLHALSPRRLLLRGRGGGRRPRPSSEVRRAVQAASQAGVPNSRVHDGLRSELDPRRRGPLPLLRSHAQNVHSAGHMPWVAWARLLRERWQARGGSGRA